MSETTNETPKTLQKAAIQEHFNRNVRAWSNRVRGKCCVLGSYCGRNVTSSEDTNTHNRTKRTCQLHDGFTNCIDRSGRVRRGLLMRNLAMVRCRFARNRKARKRLNTRSVNWCKKSAAWVCGQNVATLCPK